MDSLATIGFTQFFLFALLSLAAGAVLSFLLNRDAKASKWLAFGLGILGCLAGIAAGAAPLLGNAAPSLSLGSFAPLGTFSFQIDALSGFFVIVVSLVGLAVSIYSLVYVDEYAEKGYNMGLFGFLFDLFVLSMLLVVTSQNVLLFMVFWELMALSSFFLVTYERRDEGVKRAGFTYLLVAHAGAALLILMFLALAGSSGNSLDFASFRGAQHAPLMASLIFVLALLGFGSKAGVIPMHIWLPQAHPQAPSNISALMSGVMLKVAIYGLVRVLFDFLGASSSPAWWGVLVLALGIVSSVLGVLYALNQHDIKRLLAMHSIENIGIILLGIGASLIFASMGQGFLASLALFAALYHTLNHALFKSLLFLGAGAIASAAHTRDMEKLGGLAKLMPVTGVMFFIASFAIAGIPPLNGFVSEWLTLQALVSGAMQPGAMALVFGVAAAALALTGALAIAGFSKAFGIMFLGIPRSEKAAHAREVPAAMLAGMALLALACIGAGIFPSAIAGYALPAVSSMGFSSSAAGIVDYSAALPTFGIFILLIVLGAAALLIYWISNRLSGAPNKVDVTWDCGLYTVSPTMQYSAAGFAMPVLRLFARLINPLERKLEDGVDAFEDAVYQPAAEAFLYVSSWTKQLQSGQLPAYMLYLMLTLLGVLIYAVAGRM